MTFWDVLAFHERSTLCPCETVPTPLRDSTARGMVPETSMKESVADTAPLTVGAKVTVNAWLPQGGIVKGNVSPLTVNSGLLLTAEEIVTWVSAALSVPP